MVSKNIVILGGGIAGVQIVQKLCKELTSKSYKIILVDKSLFHIFQSDLYEVATAYNEKITKECLVQLKDSVATPIKDLIDSKKVEFINDEITKIDYTKKEISLKKNKKLSYKYLAITLGAVTNFYKIQGLEKYSYPMKTMQDAIKINCHIDQFFQTLWEKHSNKNVNIVVGGGGATGIETAAELVNSIDKLAKKYKFNRKKVGVQIIEGSNKLGSINEKVSTIIEKRFKQLKIKVSLNSYISKVTKDKIFIKNSSKQFNYDILIWTGGIMPSPVVGKAIKVRKTLQTEFDDKVFAGGDNALFEEENGLRLPQVAYVAISEGLTIAENIIRSINKKSLKNHYQIMPPSIIPLGGKMALIHYKGFVVSGVLSWFIRNLIALKYALSILPLFKAIKKWHKGNKIFITND